MRLKPLLCISLIVLALAALSNAIVWAQSMVERFERIDRDRDGKVTREEAASASWFDQLLRRFDRNRNGVLERNEIAGTGLRRRTGDTGDLKIPAEPAHTKHLNLRYAEIEGVDPNLLSLDLYVPKADSAMTKRPVMIMIHGGGWRRGDKAGPPILGAKLRHFVGKGYIYASINYRLSPETPNEDGIQHPIHAQDCAKAIAWIHDHIAEYGGDPGQLHLMGHSAGGHLAGIVGTNDRFLKAEGKDLSILKSNVLLDPAAIDIPRYVELTEGRKMTALYELAFGTNEANWRDASPQLHVAPGKEIPPTLVFYAGNRMNLDVLAPAFTDALTKAGSPSRAVDTVTLDHGQINSHIGMLDEPMTSLIMRLHVGEDASKFPNRIARRTSATAPSAPAAPSENSKSSVSRGTGVATNDTAPLMVAFTKDYTPGTRDGNGQFMGGTETMRIVAHDGKLFAGLSYWTDQPGDDPWPGAQILVKCGPDNPWEVDVSFPGVLRVSALEAVTFTTDHAGATLAKPATLLLADASPLQSRRGGALRCMVRDDSTGQWQESPITSSAARPFVRAFGSHHDRETGVDLVFGGTGAGEVYSGAYDPQVPGRIRWNTKPEYANPDFDGGAFRRCQGFCVANGKAYASISPSLVERRDGAEPTWVEVFRWKPQAGRAGQGLRGITAVPDPKGGQHEVILGSREQEGRILRIDPLDRYRVDLELQSDVFLDQTVGDFRGGKLVAYNRFVPGIDPRTGEPIHWVTVAGVKPDDARAAWLMIRHGNGRYETVRVFDPNLADPPLLVSTRTFEFAPWSDREIHTGGYDGAANNRQNHNTAWIFRGTLPPARED